MKWCAVLSILLALVACGLTKVAPSAAVEERHLAKVYFYGKGVELSKMRIDGVRKRFFDLGLQVVPGNHDVAADFMLTLEDCSPAREECYDLHIYGSCKGELRAEPGRSYAVRISGVSGAAFFVVEDEDSKVIAGSGSCRS